MTAPLRQEIRFTHLASGTRIAANTKAPPARSIWNIGPKRVRTLRSSMPSRRRSNSVWSSPSDSATAR